MEIDFVILWVDGSDTQWLEEYNRYSPTKVSKSATLYRDWDNLEYIFRAFEEFTPWVRKIHFVTYGHLPKWLNRSNKKINIVNHKDILKAKNLPTFNSNAIEMNIDKIKDLSECFVLFNDDFFITSKISKNRFFKDDLPCDILVSNVMSRALGTGHFILNNIEILNKHIDKRGAIKKDFFKWFNFSYGKNNLRNIFLYPWDRFTGFIDPHQPQAFLKSTFEEVWQKELNTLEETSASKFRNCKNINQYLFRYWQLAQGRFFPISMNDTKYVNLKFNDICNGSVSKIILDNKYCMVCLNDDDSVKTELEFNEAKNIIKNTLNELLPNKSSFEI